MSRVRKSSRPRVAVVRLSALGDVVMVLPVLYGVCRANPDTDFVFVTKKAFTGLAVSPPSNLSVIGADVKGVHKGAAGLVRLAGEIAADAVIDLHDVLRTKVIRSLLRLRGRRVTVFDKGRNDKKMLTTVGAAAFHANLPDTVTRYTEAFRRAGLDTGTRETLTFTAEETAALPFPAKGSEQWIGVAPFAAHHGKVYPLRHTTEVLQRLAARPDTRIFLFGGGSLETERLRELAHILPNTECVAGAGLGFARELALMSRLDVMLSMDSGNMHCAAATGTDTVSIWGQTHPKAGFSPVVCRPGQRHILLGDDTMACRPCSVFGNRPCRRLSPEALTDTPPCMNAVAPKTVVDAVTAILDRKNFSPAGA